MCGIWAIQQVAAIYDEECTEGGMPRSLSSGYSINNINKHFSSYYGSIQYYTATDLDVVLNQNIEHGACFVCMLGN